MASSVALSSRPLRIVLPGGSGQVGSLLARHFQQQGHHVTVLTRGPYTAPWQTVHWDGVSAGDWIATLDGADVCINLTGRGVNCRATAANRKAIYESRIHSTRLLGRVIASLAEPPRVWMNASAATINPRVLDAEGVDLPVGEMEGDETSGCLPSGAKAPEDFALDMYGLKPVPFNALPVAINPQPVPFNSQAIPFNALPVAINPQPVPFNAKHEAINSQAIPFNAKHEAFSDISSPRWAERRGFAARVARDWEAEFFAAQTPRTRKVALRSAVVLSPAPATAFGVLSNLVRLGMGGAEGNGRQFVSWIHEADYARAVEFLVAREDLEGPFNLAAPVPLVNREFMAALRWAWNVMNGLPAPTPAVRLGAWLMGTNAELVLASCRAIPRRLLDAGFEFEFSEWPEAAEDLVRQWRNRE
jgi:NAD dependent epimerase/dehydratase family enzyme